MSCNIKCLECTKDIKPINKENIEENFEPYQENDEKLKILIKKQEENLNFKINTCICLNCYDKFIREREKSNANDSKENNLLTDAMQNLLYEFESSNLMNSTAINDKELIEEEIKLKEEYETLLKEEKSTGKELEIIIEELKSLNERDEKLAENYYDLEFNTINENRKNHMLKNKANILQYQLSDFEKCKIMNQLFEISFGDKCGTINGFTLTSLWPINENTLNDIICGWSLIFHLTYIIAYKFKFESIKYYLYPFGINSKIVNRYTKEIFGLINQSNNIDQLNEFINFYLDYFSQLNDYLKNLKIMDSSKKISFNFIIEDDTIDSYRLNYSSQNMNNCAMGIKCLLMILKYYSEHSQNIIY